MPSLGESINSAISQANYQDKDMLMLIAILQAISEAGKGVGDYFGMRRAQKRFAWEEAEQGRSAKARLAEKMAYGRGRDSKEWEKRLAEDQELAVMYEQAKRAREMQEMNLASTRMNYEAATRAQKEAGVLEGLQEGVIPREEALKESKSAVAEYDKWIGTKEQTIAEKIKTQAEKAELAISYTKRMPNVGAEDVIGSYAIPGQEWSALANRIVQDAESYESGIKEAVGHFKGAAKDHPELFSRYVSDALSELGEKAGVLETTGIQSLLSDEFEKKYIDEDRVLDVLDTVMYKLAKDPDTKDEFKKQFQKAFIDEPSPLTAIYGGRRTANLPVMAEHAAAEADLNKNIRPYLERQKKEYRDAQNKLLPDVTYDIEEDLKQRIREIEEKYPLGGGGKKTTKLPLGTKDKREPSLGRELKIESVPPSAFNKENIEIQKQKIAQMEREIYLENALRKLAEAQKAAQESAQTISPSGPVDKNARLK